MKYFGLNRLQLFLYLQPIENGYQAISLLIFARDSLRKKGIFIHTSKCAFFSFFDLLAVTLVLIFFQK